MGCTTNLWMGWLDCGKGSRRWMIRHREVEVLVIGGMELILNDKIRMLLMIFPCCSCFSPFAFLE